MDDKLKTSEKNYKVGVKVQKHDELPISVNISSKCPLSVAVNKSLIQSAIYLAESWQKLDIKKEDILSERKSFMPFWVKNETGRKMKYWISGTTEKIVLPPFSAEQLITFPSSIESLISNSSFENLILIMEKYTINFQIDGIDKTLFKLPLNRVEKFLIPLSQDSSLVYDVFLSAGSKICALRSPFVVKNQCKKFLFSLIFIFIFILSWIFCLC
jgi:hypothetical protein